MSINRLFVIAGVLVALTAVILVVSLQGEEAPAPEISVIVPSDMSGQEIKSDPKNLTYIISGEVVTLSGGVSEVPRAPGSTSKVVTQYFGNELVLDVNGDGRDDTVFLLTQDGGGSGTFFYLAAALKTAEGYEGSEAVFIGDRIAPQSTTRGSVPGTVVVNYADRAAGESFAIPPSIGKSLVLKFDSATKQFGELVVDFEGEANTLAPIVPMPPVQVEDPSISNGLTSKTWQWVSASYNDGREVTPKRQEAFTLTFKTDGSFGITSDCNGGGGTYTVKGSELTLGEMMTTLMYCEGSQESEFHQLLMNTSGYHFSGAGELILDLKFDSGTVLFK